MHHILIWPQTPLMELTALPQTIYLNLRRPIGKGRGGEGSEREGIEEEGKGWEGKGRGNVEFQQLLLSNFYH